MAYPAKLRGEQAYGGEPYTLVVVRTDRAYNAGDVWSAMVRRRRGDATALGTFTVSAAAGANPDPVAGGDRIGMTVLLLMLDATEVDDLVGQPAPVCDLQVIYAGHTTPVTLLTWELPAAADVTHA